MDHQNLQQKKWHSWANGADYGEENENGTSIKFEAKKSNEVFAIN